MGCEHTSGVCEAMAIPMKLRWWKTVAVLCLILQVGFLAAGLLHFVNGERHEHRHDGCEHVSSSFPHLHVVSPEDERDAHDASPSRYRGTMAATAQGEMLFRWAMPGNIVPCPSEHCLICSLSELVRSSDVSPAGEPLVSICFVRRLAGAPAVHHLQGALRPCLPRGPPVVS